MRILSYIVSWCRGRVPGSARPGPPPPKFPLVEKRDELIENIHRRLATGEDVSVEEIRAAVFMAVERYASNTTTLMGERLFWIAPILKYKPQMAQELFTFFFEMNLIDTFATGSYERFVDFIDFYLEYTTRTNDEIWNDALERKHKGPVWLPSRVNPDGREFLSTSLRTPEMKQAIEAAIAAANEKIDSKLKKA